MHIIKDSADLDAALEDCFRFGEAVIVEEFFSGRELTVGILGDVALPVIEIVPREGFYDYEHKYTKGASEYFVPAPIGDEATQAVQYAALAAKRALGLEIYSRVDVILASDGSLNVSRDQHHSGHDGNQSAAKGRRGSGIRLSDALRTDRLTFPATHSPLNGRSASTTSSESKVAQQS